ncbi:MAG TPA: ribokinase [Puia sp.]|uniref:ribokinase n=1 Tax=Puia sp. TaxID=2045100 RepID=UPI002BBE1987|nr:ribokinase [Puia sp.]HVU94390.1 ribokinase [Puia sp.]
MKILVIGSSNTDMVAKTTHLPVPGETVLGGDFLMAPGGKGANQAVAAARMGGNVTFIAKLGNDIFGKQAITQYAQENIDTKHIVTDPAHPSGIALITVDAHGENCIVVASGANAHLTPHDIQKAEKEMGNASCILMQLEIPLETVQYVVKKAVEKNIPVILNPAPAQPLPDELLKQIHILTPNQKEAEMLTGIPVIDKPAAEAAAKALAEKGVHTVIITLGKSGALILDQGQIEWVPAPEVHAVDTTAAGDVFCGSLAVALSEKHSVKESVIFACTAAALSVTKMGAQTSAPSRREVTAFLHSTQTPPL